MTRLDKKQSIFKRIFANNIYCWISCFCTIGVMLLVYFCYNLFPFGETTILRMDLYHQYGPLFAELYDRITGLKSFLYSWQTGLGSPFLGNFFNYLSSPSMIIMLLLGHKNMPEAIAGMIIAKAALSAFTFTYYLKKSQDRHDFTSAAFGLLYAMCGYFIAYYWNVMWIDAMVYFPLVILGIEYIVKHRNPRIYIAFLALTILSSYYMGFMTCIFSAIYFVVYIFGCQTEPYDPRTPYKLDEKGNKVYSFTNKIIGNNTLRSVLTFGFASIAAAGVVAASLIPTYFILKNCSATSGTFPEDYKSYFTIFDFLANHLSSVDPTIRSSGEDVLPNVYCGMATLILVPLYLFTKSISVREKVAYVGLLGVMYFSFNVNILNYIWHGFHYPNDLPYRWSFMYSFILLILAYKAFTRLNEFSGRAILGAGLGVLGSVILIQEIGSKNVEDNTILISIIFIVTYCLVFAIMRDKKYQKSTVAVLLLCCVIGELACANTDRYNMDQPKSSFTGDYSDFRALKSELDEYDGDDMYRMELTYNRARMDPAWYGYNGISTFTSMAYEKMSNTQSDLGLDSNYINSYTYYLQTPVYNMMHALKYVVDNSNDVTVENDYFNELMTSGKFTAYENKYYLPIGYGVNSDIINWYSDLTNPFIVQSNWFEYATGIPDVFKMMTIDEVQYYNMDELTSGLETGDIYYTKTNDGEGELTFILRTDSAIRHCYLYVNSRDFDSLIIEKDDTEYTQYTDEPYVYDLGVVHPDEEVKVRITIEDVEYGYIDFYPYFVNDEALNEGYEILKNRQLNVTSFEETKIQGTVSLDENGVFFTSIPYDSGWTVKVDGKKVAKEDFVYFSKDENENPEYTYLCFNIPAGEHTIEFSFMPDGLILGIAVSVATVIALIIAAIIFAIIRKKRSKIPAYVPTIPVIEEELQAVDLELESFEQKIITEEETVISEPETSEKTVENTDTLSEETVMFFPESEENEQDKE